MQRKIDELEENLEMKCSENDELKKKLYNKENSLAECSLVIFGDSGRYFGLHRYCAKAVLPVFIYDCLVQKSDQIVKLGSRTKVYLKSLIRDLDLELEAIIAMSPPPTHRKTFLSRITLNSFHV